MGIIPTANINIGSINGVMVYIFRKSLVYHDGNNDSKMHPEIRRVRKYYTVNYIDDEEKNK